MPAAAIPRLDLVVFTATRPEEVPDAARPFASVDGSVPGAAWTWDHHRSGESINLDAMPLRIDVGPIQGVGTTLADCDALASVVALMFGGEDRLPGEAREVLRAASWRCDHLRDDPNGSARANRLGDGLNRFVGASLSQAEPQTRGAAFAALCRGVAVAIARGEPLPSGQPADGPAAAEVLRALGRLRVAGDRLTLDWRGFPNPWRVPPDVAFAAAPGARVGVWVDDHPAGGNRYTVGASVAGGARDLAPMLRHLARLEHAHGPPCHAPDPVPGAENWGGRATVFGSPWNYGSRLELETVERAWEETRGECLYTAG